MAKCSVVALRVPIVPSLADLNEYGHKQMLAHLLHGIHGEGFSDYFLGVSFIVAQERVGQIALQRVEISNESATLRSRDSVSFYNVCAASKPRQHSILGAVRLIGDTLQPGHCLADCHSCIDLLFEPADHGNVTLGIEPVSTFGALWLAHVVAPLPGTERAGANTRRLYHGLDVIEGSGSVFA